MAGEVGGVRAPAGHDRILDFSTAVTGSLFFVPTADFLDGPPPRAEATTAALAGADGTEDDTDNTAAEPAPRTDGSLGIGSLRRSGTS